MSVMHPTSDSRHVLALLAFAAATLQMPSQAQTADPTRPPAAWLAAQQPLAPGAPPAAQPATSDASIVVAGPTRRFAVVDGHAIRVGDMHNGSRLVAINGDGLVWRKAGVQEISRMSRGVEKTAPGKQTRIPPSAQVQKKIVNGDGK